MVAVLFLLNWNGVEGVLHDQIKAVPRHPTIRQIWSWNWPHIGYIVYYWLVDSLILVIFGRLKISNKSSSRVLKSWCLDSWCGNHDEIHHGIQCQQNCLHYTIPTTPQKVCLAADCPCRPDTCSWPSRRLVESGVFTRVGTRVAGPLGSRALSSSQASANLANSVGTWTFFGSQHFSSILWCEPIIWSRRRSLKSRRSASQDAVSFMLCSYVAINIISIYIYLYLSIPVRPSVHASIHPSVRSILSIYIRMYIFIFHMQSHVYLSNYCGGYNQWY